MYIIVLYQTIGCDFYEKNLEIRKDIFVSLRVWDIGGQSINSNNLNKYLGSSQVVFIVYDCTNPDSFSNLDDWLTAVRKFSKSELIYLVANKIDLINLRQITDKMHEQFIISNKLSGGFYVSAKTGDNLVKAFYKVAGEAVHITLSPSELAYHDKVIKAHIVLGSSSNTMNTNKDDEGRTAFADEIERQDAEAERLKNKCTVNMCTCSQEIIIDIIINVIQIH